MAYVNLIELIVENRNSCTRSQNTVVAIKLKNLITSNCSEFLLLR